MGVRAQKRFGAIIAMTAIVVAGAACEPGEPPPPPPELAVTTEVDLPDADPGDGVCEATPDTGDCTLRAAVDEANALGRADLVVPAGSYELATSLAVTGAVGVNVGHPAAVNLYASGPTTLVVPPGGSLALDGVVSWLPLDVEGAVVVRRSRLLHGNTPPLTVRSGGVAVLQHSRAGALSGGVAVRNHGDLLVDYAEVGGKVLLRFIPVDLGALETASGGNTHLRASWLASGCVGPAPTSLGRNAAADPSCSLTGTGDLEDAPPVVTPTLVTPPDALVDTIAVGELGCGTTVTFDADDRPRPVDGDGDGTAACDTGAEERPAP